MDWQAGETIALVVMAIIEAITIIFYCREKAAKNKSEQELKQIKRRSDAPYLTPSDTFFTGINFIFEKDEPRTWLSDSPNLLCFQRDEVDPNLASGNLIIFVVDNAGESARAIIVKLDGEQIALKREADRSDSKGLIYLEYAYNPQKHGKEQTLTISFETRNGVQDTHRYIIRHGFRVLQRIDPTLP
jgi:hypothetical protein